VTIRADPSEETSPAVTGAAPIGRIFRRPSDRFRRESPRRVRHQLAIRIADAVSLVAARLPDWLRNGIADRVGDVWVRLTPVYRANVIANLGQVFGPETPRPILEAMAANVFRMSARNFGELLRLRHLSADQLKAILPMAPADILLFTGAAERSQGVVIISAHLGAFDLMGHAIAAQGIPITAITGRTTSRFLFDAITHLRRGNGITPVEPTPGGVRRVIQALRRGEAAAFVADYDFFQNGLPVTFFGRETTLPPGPVRIARDTGSLIVPMFPRRVGDEHLIVVGEPFVVPRTRDIDADLATGMELMRRQLELGIGAIPEQWVLFQRAWPLEPAPPVRVFPVGSPLESELLKRVDAVLPPARAEKSGEAPAPPVKTPRGRMEPPPQSPAP
jgi:KDO2-lipid IV(A) lauroyltransferase